MDIKFKKTHTLAKAPQRASSGAAAYDLYAADIRLTAKYIEVDTGIAIEIPEGYFGLLVPRSSVTNKDLMLKNSIGVIDSDYRGPIKARFVLVPYRNTMAKDFEEDFDLDQYKINDKCAQLVIMPVVDYMLCEVDMLSATNRDKGGFGSTGN